MIISQVSYRTNGPLVLMEKEIYTKLKYRYGLPSHGVVRIIYSPIMTLTVDSRCKASEVN